MGGVRGLLQKKDLIASSREKDDDVSVFGFSSLRQFGESVDEPGWISATMRK
jgi:hypothetical protein